MSRKRSAAAAAPSRKSPELLAEIFEWTKEYALVAAVLGPPGAGKTTLLKQAAEASADRGIKAVLLDLMEASDFFDVDQFYLWLVRRLKDEWWQGAKTASPRLDFCSMLGQALAKRRQPVLLMLDHLECLAEPCAHALVSDLREVQDRADSSPTWGRLRCVIAGRVSVFELRRRLNSPNLQFRLHILPPGDAEANVDKTRDYLHEHGLTCDEFTVRYLAAQTGGEAVFLELVKSGLSGPQIGIAEAKAAVQSLLRTASQYPHFRWPAWLYIVDEELKSKVDRILDGRPYCVPIPRWILIVIKLPAYWSSSTASDASSGSEMAC